jgi:hypothetical protein
MGKDAGRKRRMTGTGKNREDRKTEMGSGKKAKQKIQKRQKGKGGEENGKNRDLYGRRMRGD